MGCGPAPRAQRKKAKTRFERFDEVNAQEAPTLEEDMELVIPPPQQLGNRVVDVSGLGMELGGRKLFSGFSYTFENGRARGDLRSKRPWAKPRC